MKQLKLIAVVAIISSYLLSGCNDQNPHRHEKHRTETNSRRINITSIQFGDDAVGYVGTILVLRDSQTSKEYIAVLGAGITEIR